MNQSEKAKFLEVLAGVHDFYGKELTKFAGTVWLQSCQGFELEQVTKALSSHLMDPERGQFMPKPADLVRQLQGTATDRSLIAWGKVLDAIQRVGAYSSVVFDDPAIHAAVSDLGGWSTVCRTSHDELQWLQKRFTDSHKAYSGRVEFDYPAKLLGAHDLENARRGHGQASPVLVGNVDAAKKTLTSGSAGSKTQFTQLGSAVPQLQIRRQA